MAHEEARQRSQPTLRRFAELQHGHHAVGLGDPRHFPQSVAPVGDVANPERRAATVVCIGAVAFLLENKTRKKRSMERGHGDCTKCKTGLHACADGKKTGACTSCQDRGRPVDKLKQHLSAAERRLVAASRARHSLVLTLSRGRAPAFAPRGRRPSPAAFAEPPPRPAQRQPCQWQRPTRAAGGLSPLKNNRTVTSLAKPLPNYTRTKEHHPCN